MDPPPPKKILPSSIYLYSFRVVDRAARAAVIGI